MGKDIRDNDFDRLCDAFLSLNDREEVYKFLSDLCTIKEIDSMKQRLEVATLLKNKETYQKIAEETGASTATISRVNRAFAYGDDGYTMVLGRIGD